MSLPAAPIPARIFTIRGLRVILDSDLARLYGVPNKRLNEQVQRNRAKFPEDFCFQLNGEETANLKSQFATSSSDASDSEQTKPGSSRQMMGYHGGTRKLPWVFTEHGALMAANVLRSPRATEMAIYVVRAFVKQREALTTNAAILKRLAEIDKTLLEHDNGLRLLWHRLQPLLTPPTPRPSHHPHHGQIPPLTIVRSVDRFCALLRLLWPIPLSVSPCLCASVVQML